LPKQSSNSRTYLLVKIACGVSAHHGGLTDTTLAHEHNSVASIHHQKQTNAVTDTKGTRKRGKPRGKTPSMGQPRTVALFPRNLQQPTATLEQTQKSSVFLQETPVRNGETQPRDTLDRVIRGHRVASFATFGVHALRGFTFAENFHPHQLFGIRTKRYMDSKSQ
jgi:hypothetical protein